MSKPILWIVIPCYNEEQVLPITAPLFLKKINDLSAAGLVSEKSRVLFVNDGSKDETWNIIEDLHAQDPLFLGLKLSRNKGHQNALLAGLMTAKEYADVTISMDADLQDDVHVIEKFMDKYYEGCDIVYGVRSSRKKDTFFKKFTAQSFYRLMMAMGVDIVYNHADCRLMSKRSLYDLEQFKEVNLFLRGIQVSAEKNAGLRHGRDYLVQHQADPDDHQHGCDHFCDQHSYADLLCGAAFPGQYGQRLVLYHGVHLGHRRSADPFHGCHRRVCGQDLYGSKGETEVYH